ncbi:MAG: KEOPS complex subunit Cgi121 [Candidatus Bathyarchaeia archaeon]|nr:hypothetical protein [Candidatus Bathyarchaeota archaeon]
MIKVEVLDKYIIVEGFRNVKISDVESFLNLIKAKAGGTYVQVLDANMVAGFEHIYFAVLNALKSFRANLNMSKNLAIEVMLFASGQDQIKNAIEILGVKPGLQNIVVIIIAESKDDAESALGGILSVLSGERDEGVIELTEEKIPSLIKAFNISRLELEAFMRGSLRDALKNAIIERMALLITQR